ncbi:pilin N-terminal domain-containing protein [Enterococcus gilvus]|uniref:pilin N-terminal domain-containing protein n=1 Tax=Enterococcus gilvus TaxID=160453 RepID=UPI003EDB2CD9
MKKLFLCFVLIGGLLALTPLVHADQSTAPTGETSASPHTQTLHIQKIVNQTVNDSQGEKNTQTQGVNGAHFTVYNVTKLYETIQKEQKQNKQPIKNLTQEVLKQAQKQAVQELPVVFGGTTATKDGQEGILTGILSFDPDKPTAYYIVNDKTDTDTTTTSQDAVLMAPISDDKGAIQKDIWLYPKAEQPKKETHVIVSTGMTPSWITRVRRFIGQLL